MDERDESALNVRCHGDAYGSGQPTKNPLRIVPERA